MMNRASQLPAPLVEAVRHGRLIPLVGSLIAQEVVDPLGSPFLPDWRVLLDRAADELHRLSRLNEERVLRQLLDKRQPDWYQAMITARSALPGSEWLWFLYTQLNPSYRQVATHSLSCARAVWALGGKLVVTVTHGRLLDWSCPDHQDLTQWVLEPPEYALHEPIERFPAPVLWFLHGRVDDPASMILTPGGRRRLHPDSADGSRRYRAALGVLHQLMTTRTMLFVGFGQKDLYYLELMAQLYDYFHQVGGPHYVLVPQEELSYHQDRMGTLPLELVGYESLEECLVELTQKTLPPEESLSSSLETEIPTLALRPKLNAGAGEEVIQLPSRYQVRGKMGQGGMGIVYRAYDRHLDREVAIKVILPSLMSPEADTRFSMEARAIAKLDHPGIVPVFDFGRHHDTVFLTMPLVEGKLLRVVMREQIASLPEKLDIISQLAEALDYSHSRGVIHCDIKPENIMVRQEAGAFRVRIMDFGLARIASHKRLYIGSDVAGTPLYLSPEQCMSAEVDGRADLYALGTILYEFLTGDPPFRGTFHSLVYKIVHERPPLLLSRGVEVDEELESLVLRCLAKKPENRPQRGRDLALALDAYLKRRFGRLGGTNQLVMQQTYLSGPVLVGREAELSELALRLDACLAGVCQLAVIGGDSGMGKTRLLSELEKLALESREPFQVWWGRFPDLEGSLPYQVFTELICSFFADTSKSVPDLRDLAADLIQIMPVLGEIPTLRELVPTTLPVGSKEKGRDQRYVFDLMARTLVRLSGDKPTVIMLENLGGAGGSLDALHYLVHRLAPTPTLIVGTYRTGFPKSHPLNRFLRNFQGDRRFLQLELAPLDENQHRRLVVDLLGGEEASMELLERLYETSEGNPFFCQELVRNLLEGSALTRNEQGQWDLSEEASLHDDILPGNIQGTVEERLKHLPETARDTLGTAAILGRRFTFADLEALDAHPQSLDETLDMLICDGIIAEDPRSRREAFIFQSKVVRDVLYQHFSRRKRRNLHLRYAHYLERVHAGKLERIYPELVYHFSEGDDADKTVLYAVGQAQRALDAFAPDDAIRSVEIALRFVRDKDYQGAAQVEGKLCLLLARAQLALGHLEQALLEAGEAVRAYKRGNDAQHAAEAALLAAETSWRLHKIDSTRRWVDNGIVLARAVDGCPALYGLLTLAAKVANLSRNYEFARICLKEAELLSINRKVPSLTGPIPLGGTLRCVCSTVLPRLQPGYLAGSAALEFAALVFEPLLIMDSDGVPVPLLAERWEGIEDNAAFRFYLDPQARFSDGSALLAEHVSAAFHLAACGPSGRNAPGFQALLGIDAFLCGETPQIEGLVVENSHALLFRLKKPLPLFPVLLADPGNTGIFLEAPSQEGLRLGTGPFCLVEEKSGLCVLARNKHYWRQVLAMLEFVEVNCVQEVDLVAEELRRGTYDMALSLPPKYSESLLKLPVFQRGLVEGTCKRVACLVLNAKSELFTSIHVRHHLLGSLRVRELVWNSLGHVAQPAPSLFPPGIFGHDGGRRSPASKDQAAFSFQEWGRIPPVTLRVNVHPLFRGLFEPMAHAIFREWLTLGFTVEPVELQNQADLALIFHQGAYDDPDAFVYPLCHSQHGEYGSWVGKPERDDLLEMARACPYGDQRRQLYGQIESELLKEGLILPLCYEVESRLVATRVKGIKRCSFPPYLDYLNIGKVSDQSQRTTVGTIRVPLLTELSHLDPALMSSYDYGEVVPNIFETLSRVGEGALVEPWLASFRSDDGGHSYLFQLRENVYFHDGRRLTARDVRYSFERVLRDSHLHGPLLHVIKGADAFCDGRASELAGLTILADRTFRIELEKPLSFFPGILTHPALAIMPEGLVPCSGHTETHVGTGPFRLVSIEPESRVVLEANLQYWNKGYPCCDRLEFLLGMTPTQVAKGFREGALTVATGVYPNELEAIRQRGGYRQAMSEAPGLSTYFCVFNTHQGFFADREARRAFARSVDLAAIVRETLAGTCIAAGGFIPPGLAGREANQIRHIDGPHRTSPPTGPVRAAVHPSFFSQFAGFWEQTQEAYEKIGFHIEPVYRSVIGNLEEIPGPVDLVIYRWFADYPDADTFVKLIHSRAGLFGRMVGSSRLDLLFEKGRIETDASLRTEIYLEVEEIIARDMLILPLFHETNYRVAQPHVEGLRTRIGFPIVSYESLQLNDPS